MQSTEKQFVRKTVQVVLGFNTADLGGAYLLIECYFIIRVSLLPLPLMFVNGNSLLNSIIVNLSQPVIGLGWIDLVRMAEERAKKCNTLATKLRPGVLWLFMDVG